MDDPSIPLTSRVKGLRFTKSFLSGLIPELAPESRKKGMSLTEIGADVDSIMDKAVG